MPSLWRVWREGLVVGLIGAAAIAAWFFLVDIISGQPLYTPAVLGAAMLNVIGDHGEHTRLTYAAAYTPFHLLAFMLVGLASARLLEAARHVPNLTAGLLLLFVVFETGFYFITGYVSQFDVLGRLAWYQIGAANAIAAGVMGWYLLRHHPELKTSLWMALDERI